jgi:NADP-dependent 3-hydroxy acid dehydrogenase YdfG
MSWYAGHVALVTGASSGIGEATALALAQQGFRVAVAARRLERLEALVARIRQAGGEACAVQADITVEEQARAMVQQAHAQWGRLDVLINNAGLMLLAPIAEGQPEEWRRMIATNILGLLYATQAALPIMKAQGGGHIVNLSSLAGRIARAGCGVYNATKWGVIAISEALRQECLKDHIRVTVVEPGVVATELAYHISHPGMRESELRRFQEMKALESVDIANAIVYAVTQPPHVSVNEILIRPSEQER